MKSPKSPISLYSRLALITSVTLVVGYFVVYAVYENINSEEVASNATITSTLMGKIKNNLDTLNTQVTDLTATVMASSIWSKVGSDINYTAGKVGVGATTGNAELDIQSGTKPHWGIYHDSTTEELRFWNGDNRVVIGSTGNVGIGTVSPVYKLDITGQNARLNNASSTVITYFDVANSYGTTRIGTDANGIGYLGTASNLPLGLFSGNTERMRIDTSGNVGIGTVAPTNKLSVFGATSTSNNFAGYPGYMDNSYSPNGFATELNIYRPYSYIINGPTYRGGLSFGDGVGIYSVNENPGGSGYYGDIRFYTTTWPVDHYVVYDRMVITRAGNVGIGTITPDAILDVVGTAHANSWAAHSDIRLKKGIQTLTGALDKIYSINGVSYYWKEKNMIGKEFSDNKQIGVIAQEVEKVYPEIVETSKTNGYKTVDYGKITPVLIEAIKELKSQKDLENRELKNQISEFKKENDELKTRIENLENK